LKSKEEKVKVLVPRVEIFLINNLNKHRITGIEITDMTAKMDPNSGKISEYRACIQLSFGVEN
jgi:hypothetical protein